MRVWANILEVLCTVRVSLWVGGAADSDARITVVVCIVYVFAICMSLQAEARDSSCTESALEFSLSLGNASGACHMSYSIAGGKTRDSKLL